MKFFLLVIVLLFSINLSLVASLNEIVFKELQPGFSFEYSPKANPKTSNVAELNKIWCNCRLKQFGKIIGGEKASGYIPWMVSIANSSNSHMCGGVIINQDIVLTAATCVTEDEKAKKSKIRVGLYNLDDPDILAKTIDVENVFPNFLMNRYYSINEPIKNNIAILKLEKKIEFIPGKVEPACLNFVEEQYEGRNMLFAGWGSESKHIIVPSNPQLNIVNEPSRVLKTLSLVEATKSCHRSFICVDDHSKKLYNAKDSPGVFDEGGPLHSFKNGRISVEGILSAYGELKMDSTHAGEVIHKGIGKSYFARLSHYKLWFENIVGDNYCIP